MISSSSKRKREHLELQSDLTGGLENQHLSAHPLNHEGTSPDARQKDRKKIRVWRGDVPAPSPLVSRYLPIVFGGSRWYARDSFQKFVVFGDSYSTSHEGKTWVDYLQQQLQKQGDPPDIHNFSSPGATAEDDLPNQLLRFFTEFPKKESTTQTPALDPDGTTYFVFLGINDCANVGYDGLENIIETISDALHDLYVKAGARNFILIDVPPIDRSPQAIDSESANRIEECVKAWNELLQTQAADFVLSAKEATALVFSSHQVLMDVLDDPLEYDFTEDDPETEGGCIWMDDLHLSLEVHHILAQQLLLSVLGSQS